MESGSLTSFFDPPKGPGSLLDGSFLEGRSVPQNRPNMSRFILELDPPKPASSATSGVPMPTLSGGFSPGYLPSFVPNLVALVGQIRQELENNPTKLLALNSSRRDAMAQHLDRLASQPSPAPVPPTPGDPGGALKRWVTGPRSAVQNQALRLFFEEVAWIALGQALLLKAWSDRGIRACKPADLADLNWALSQALKPHVPLDREGWQITRPNLYSWYKPSPAVQQEIWGALDSWRVTEEGPTLLASLMRMARPTHQSPELHGYDSRFFATLWQQMAAHGFDASPDQGPMKRQKIVFSPTLRDGALVRSAPASLSWIGFESHPFQLLVAEMVQLWWGPSSPPMWALGTGLESHSRDQLALALGSPKQTLIHRIADMEACDLAIVLEERCVRSGARTPESARLREQLDALPYFKKIRAGGSSLGDLQACVSLSKLRPGGQLWWAREEPLATVDGNELLGFLLEHGKLLHEWDFSAVEHSLPVGAPLFPRYLYLFSRETQVAARMAHRPTRVVLGGQIRSHIEVPLILEDAFKRAENPRGHWQIHSHVSPTSQKEWAERWPDAAAVETLHEIEQLREASEPLASFTTVRTSPAGDPGREGAWSVPPALRGLWLHLEESSEGHSRLRAAELPRVGSEARHPGFLVLATNEAWIAPLARYLESKLVHRWLEHHAERRGVRWVLNEQLIKFIPVPKVLLEAIGTQEQARFATPLPGDWEKYSSEISHHPKQVAEKLSSLKHDADGSRIRATLFVRTARAIEQLRSSQGRLLALVNVDGSMDWKQLLNILPKSECVALTLHPAIRLSGALPAHLPIGRMDRVRTPSPGILLATESGLNLRIESELPRILEIIWAQLKGLNHPTWSELTQYLRLPRQLELAESTASEILMSHGDQTARLAQMLDLLSACLSF